MQEKGLKMPLLDMQNEKRGTKAPDENIAMFDKYFNSNIDEDHDSIRIKIP